MPDKSRPAFNRSSAPVLDGWSIAATLIPARQTSGDFYDFIELPNGKLGVLVADVADKGTGAALYMALGRTLLRTFAQQYPDNPAEVFRKVNDRLFEDSRADQFVSVFYGVLEPATGNFEYCNAGHNPLFLLRADHDFKHETLSRTGVALGAMSGDSGRGHRDDAIPAKAPDRQTAQQVRGAEYARAVKEGGNRRHGEAGLDKRTERVESLHLRTLAAGDRERFVDSWRRIQARFVDGPASAVAEADQLLGDVMSTRGYPVSEFAQRAADISVDHPLVLEHYRTAHDIAVRQTKGEASTEDLRQAMIHYRSLFEELVGEPETPPMRVAS